MDIHTITNIHFVDLSFSIGIRIETFLIKLFIYYIPYVCKICKTQKYENLLPPSVVEDCRFKI